VIFVGEELTEFGFIREECEKNFENHWSSGCIWANVNNYILTCPLKRPFSVADDVEAIVLNEYRVYFNTKCIEIYLHSKRRYSIHANKKAMA